MPREKIYLCNEDFSLAIDLRSDCNAHYPSWTAYDDIGEQMALADFNRAIAMDPMT